MSKEITIVGQGITVKLSEPQDLQESALVEISTKFFPESYVFDVEFQLYQIVKILLETYLDGEKDFVYFEVVELLRNTLGDEYVPFALAQYRELIKLLNDEASPIKVQETSAPRYKILPKKNRN